MPCLRDNESRHHGITDSFFEIALAPESRKKTPMLDSGKDTLHWTWDMLRALLYTGPKEART